MGTTTVAHIYNLLPAAITSGACVVAPVDVVPNVILQSTAIVSAPSIVSNASAVFTSVLISTNIEVDTPELYVPYLHVKGPFNNSYNIKRTFMVLWESRSIVIQREITGNVIHVEKEDRTIRIPKAPRDTTYTTIAENRNMRIQ